jgi:hypothetical protein
LFQLLDQVHCVSPSQKSLSLGLIRVEQAAA